MFSKEALEDFIGLDVVIARCNTIDPEHFPEHELSLKTLRSHLDAWKQGKTAMDNQPDKTKRPQIEMPYAEAVDDSGRCVLCGGEVAQVFDEVIAEHYGVYQNLASDQDGGHVEVFEYKCKACGNESFDGFGNQM